MLQEGQILLDRYEIGQLLGQGGFGQVHLALDTRLNRKCAIKASQAVSEAATRQFKLEAQVLANLSHPNLPRVTDYFVLPEQGQFLVMDYVEGHDLEKMLEEAAGPLPVDQALRWIMQICDALSYLHGQNPSIIHRDIKPANIKITPQGAAILVDFGIAKLYDPQKQTTVGARALTYGYSPPEQYGKKHGLTDERSDQYALAATLYHLLTGEMPPESLAVYLKSEPPARPVHSINPRVPGYVSMALERGMQVEKNRRYASVADFKAGLLAPPRTLPAPPPSRAASPMVSVTPLPGKTTSRFNPWLFVALFGLGIFLALLAAGGGWWALKLWNATPTVPAIVVVPASDTPAPGVSVSTATDTPVLPSLTPTLPSLAIEGPKASLPQARLAFVSGNPKSEELYYIDVKAGEYNAEQLDNLEPFGAPERVPTGLTGQRIWWPEWCLGNRVIYFEIQYNNGNKQTIGVYSFETGQTSTLSPPNADYDEIGVPSCAWNGQALLFSAHNVLSSEWHLFRYDYAGPVNELVTGLKFAGNPAWGPDDSWIAFMGQRRGATVKAGQTRAYFELFRTASNTVNDYTQLIEQVPLPDRPAIPVADVDMLYPAVNPLDGRVAFACFKDDWNLCMCDAQGDNFDTPLENLNQSDSNLTQRVTPSWSPDGQWIAYMAIGPNNDWDIYLYSLVFARSFNLTDRILTGNQLQPRWSK